MLNSEYNRKRIIEVFPKLANDKSFKITSKDSPNYNCIAWAGLEDQQWWQPGMNYDLEGVKFRWPPNIPSDNILKNHDSLEEGYL